ncbi:MAG: sensor domain-containing protein, partial [Sciscionella sp.]|nr:sensor domain-containing protein [Sciscionella sp.]
MTTDDAAGGCPIEAEHDRRGAARRADPGRPNPIKAIGFMIASFPLRIIAFVLTVVLGLLGIGTSIVWLGVPILIGATALVNGFGTLERRWVSAALDYPIPAPPRQWANERPARRWFARGWLASVTDPTTWREFGYLVLALPIGVLEFGLGIASIVLFPLALWVLPWIGWLHGQWARSMLGPNRSTELAAKAEHLAASRARGVDAAEAERRRIERDLHDGAQQRLVAVAMGLGRAKSKMDTDPTAARELIDEAHADAKQAIAELRDLARGIYPAVLGDRGLDAALSALAAKCPVPVTVEVAPSVIADPRPPVEKHIGNI